MFQLKFPSMKTKPCSTLLLVPALTLGWAASALAQAPANDNFAAAIAIPPATGLASGDNTNATVETGEPTPHFQSLATFATAGKSVWFSYTPTTTALVYVNGTPKAAVGLNLAVYSGNALTALNRLAGAYSAATANAKGQSSNLFRAEAGTTYYIQVNGITAAGVTAFDLEVAAYPVNGTVVLPCFSSWESLHPTTLDDPTTDANWAAKWKIPGDATTFTAAALAFKPAAPAPIGYEVLERSPGLASNNFGTPASVAADATNTNNAGYVRTTFTLAQATSNLWAEVIVDDGAYIYIDDLPGVPVHIAAKLTGTSSTVNGAQAISDGRPWADAHLTGLIPAAAGTSIPGCRAAVPAGFTAERNTRLVFLGGITGRLSAGPHRIAVSLHQNNRTSSDLAVDLQLIDMQPRKLPLAGAGITFNDSNILLTSATTSVVPILEHHFAPSPGQSDLAWYCVSPTTRGATTGLWQGTVYSDATSGNQKALRLHQAEAQKFVTEPLSVDGMAEFTASIRIRTNVTTGVWEAADGFRVFLETSNDGVTWAEPSPALELQPQINGPAAEAIFSAAFVKKSLRVVPNAHKNVRLVVTGGVDESTENLYLDDVRFDACLIQPVVAAVVFDNKGNDDKADDTVNFDLSATGSGTTGPGWTSVGLSTPEAMGLIGGAAVPVSRPVTYTGTTTTRQNISVTVKDDGNATCVGTATVTVPVAAIGTVTVTAAVRDHGALPNDPSDDTWTFDVTIPPGNSGVSYEVRSNDTANTTLYATGTYGTTPVSVTVPVTATGLTIVDKAEPTLKKAAALSLAGTEIAIGRTRFGAATGVLYNAVPTLPATSAWRQAITNATDAALTLDAYTFELNPGAAIAAPAIGVVATPAVDVTGKTGVVVTARLRAFEASTSSGFETDDTFKIEVTVNKDGTDTTTNLVDGSAADKDASKLLNGYTTTTAAPYDSNKDKDEFNLDLAAVAGKSAGTFEFSFPVPDGSQSVTVTLTGANNSANEHYFIQNLLIADGASDPNRDSDGDGESDTMEAVAGTDPNNPNDVLRLPTIDTTAGGANATFAFPTKTGRSYAVYASADLASWTLEAGSVQSGTGSNLSFTFPSPGSGRARYYCIAVRQDSAFPATLP